MGILKFSQIRTFSLSLYLFLSVCLSHFFLRNSSKSKYVVALCLKLFQIPIPYCLLLRPWSLNLKYSKSHWLGGFRNSFNSQLFLTFAFSLSLFLPQIFQVSVSSRFLISSNVSKSQLLLAYPLSQYSEVRTPPPPLSWNYPQSNSSSFFHLSPIFQITIILPQSLFLLSLKFSKS